MIKARLSANIPENRFSTINGRTPIVGDLVVIDQGFTFPEGQAGCLVYLQNAEGNYEYEAEVYETELDESESVE